MIDNKTFQNYPTGMAKEYAAQRQVRSAYPPKKPVLTPVCRRLPSTLIQNTGPKSRRRQRQGARGNGEAPRQMYSRHCRRALERLFEEVGASNQHASGHKSTAGVVAKADAGITSLDSLKRLPDAGLQLLGHGHQENAESGGKVAENRAEDSASLFGTSSAWRQACLASTLPTLLAPLLVVCSRSLVQAAATSPRLATNNYRSIVRPAKTL